MNYYQSTRGEMPCTKAMNWEGKMDVHPIQLQEVLAVEELSNFICCQRYSASTRLKALVNESIDTDTESMIRIIFWLA